MTVPHASSASVPPSPVRDDARTGATRPALSDTATLRARARASLADGEAADARREGRAAIVEVLNRALATELVCVLRYKRHAFTAKGLAAEPVVAEFTAHAAEEARHADQLAARISELGGEPDFAPSSLVTRSHAEYDASTDLLEMIRADLLAERIAIEAYGEAIRFVGDGDPTTRRLLESILAMEEEHADDLRNLLDRHRPRPA